MLSVTIGNSYVRLMSSLEDKKESDKDRIGGGGYQMGNRIKKAKEKVPKWKRSIHQIIAALHHIQISAFSS